MQAPVVEAYAESLHNVFLWAVPVALLALVVALFLPQVTLRGRRAGRRHRRGLRRSRRVPTPTPSWRTSSARCCGSKGKSAAPEVLAAFGQRAGHPDVLGRDGRLPARGHHRRRRSQSAIERSVGIPPGVLRSFFDEIVEAGYLTRDGDTLRLTEPVGNEVDLIITAWRAWLCRNLPTGCPLPAPRSPRPSGRRGTRPDRGPAGQGERERVGAGDRLRPGPDSQ